MTDMEERLEEWLEEWLTGILAQYEQPDVTGEPTILYPGSAEDLAAALYPALRQSQDIEAAAREINRLWFDIEGTGSSSYAADTVRERGNDWVEAMWTLRAALAPKAEEAPR